MTARTDPMQQPAGFCEQAWQNTAQTRRAIDALPFLTELVEGTLPAEVFSGYLHQDALYLRQYGRALCLTAAKADLEQELSFFATAAAGIITVELQLHQAHTDGRSTVAVDAGHAQPVDGAPIGKAAPIAETAPPSPVCTAYTSFLLGTAATQGYPELVAAVLPCFWIYADVGATVLRLTGDLAGHPYADWISTYSDEAFDAQVAQARSIADRVAAAPDPATVQRMHTAFGLAVEYERQFWQAAYDRQGWEPGRYPQQ